MSGIIICKTKTADNPYTFLNTKITIYSYEELCYYIFNNMVLIGKDDLADRLSNWLRTAIDMEDLADKIDALNAKNAYIQDIMVEILTFGEFYSKDEVKEFMDECKRIRTLKPYELDKKRADSYMMYKHYIKADAIYDDIIEYKESHGEYDEFLGNIYHNKGVALAGNLQLEEAKDAFIRAFAMKKKSIAVIMAAVSLAVVVAVFAGCGEPVRGKDGRDGLKGRDGLSTYEIFCKNYIYIESEKQWLDDLMNEIADSKEDVHEMSIYNKVQKAVYNRMHGDIEDYDRRMNSILSALKDQFRNQIG